MGGRKVQTWGGGDFTGGGINHAAGVHLLWQTLIALIGGPLHVIGQAGDRSHRIRQFFIGDRPWQGNANGDNMMRTIGDELGLKGKLFFLARIGGLAQFIDFRTINLLFGRIDNYASVTELSQFEQILCGQRVGLINRLPHHRCG